MRAMKPCLKNIILALKHRMLAEDSHERSMRQALARRPFLRRMPGIFLARKFTHDPASVEKIFLQIADVAYPASPASAFLTSDDVLAGRSNLHSSGFLSKRSP